eukprot:TRINITY_DN20839_c0_g1_i1.p1 TRINITY_DN20839_c0_g1~~TRINITY_DN20839_c0_g1_i1.p1  ORF type:complete len:118 (+),score=26.53 TRINITY_DN20839_c0_g1_i1:100-453(+)
MDATTAETQQALRRLEAEADSTDAFAEALRGIVAVASEGRSVAVDGAEFSQGIGRYYATWRLLELLGWQGGTEPGHLRLPPGTSPHGDALKVLELAVASAGTCNHGARSPLRNRVKS